MCDGGYERVSVVPHRLAVGRVLFAQESPAQDYTRWGLPEGAFARLGKGSLHGDLAYSPDGTRLAVAGIIGIWLYDVHTGTEVALLPRHTAIRSVSYSPDGQTLASGGDEGSIRLWDVATGQELAILEGHTKGVLSVDFSPDGTTLASASRDGKIRLWDVASGQQKATLALGIGAISVTYSPDGMTLASANDGGGDESVRIWDVASGQQKATLEVLGADLQLPRPLPVVAYLRLAPQAACRTEQGNAGQTFSPSLGDPGWPGRDVSP